MSDAPVPGAQLAAALVAFQSEMPVIRKTEEGVIQGKDGKQGYRYSYADLAGVAEQVYPLLTKHGLSFTGFPTLSGDRFVLRYYLLHESGEQLAGEYPLSGGSAQAVGSAITYARRYCLVSVTGVAPEDDDGDAATNQPAPTREPAAQAPALPADVVEGRTRVGNLWAELNGDAEPNVRTLAQAYAKANNGADIWQADGAALRKFAGALSAGGIEIPGKVGPGPSAGSPDPDEGPPAAEAGPIGNGARKAVFAALGKLGVRDDEESRYTLGVLAGRVLGSRSELTVADGRRILDQLRDVKTRDELERVMQRNEAIADD